ncbi:hypothetical protein KXR53_14040 [Inquilinus limosus]
MLSAVPAAATKDALPKAYRLALIILPAQSIRVEAGFDTSTPPRTLTLRRPSLVSDSLP